LLSDLATAAARRARTSRPARIRLAVAALALTAAGAGAVQLLPGGLLPSDVTTVAMGPAELSPSLPETVESCVDRFPEQPVFDTAHRTALQKAELAVAIEHQGRATALFFAADGWVACDEVRQGRESSGGYGGSLWYGQKDWLPGPVQRLSVSSSDLESGWVMAAGRVSARVDRLVLDHGNGSSTEARLANGAFGLITTNADVQPAAELIAYDATGAMIEREGFFEPMSVPSRCYTDPTGRVVYSRVVEPDNDCLPAERWEQ
jgi:hypothetical protein